jgi:hypothetical protein
LQPTPAPTNATLTLAGWLRELCDSNDDYLGYVDIKPVRWRINRGAPHYGVWTEYPICLNKDNHITGLGAWDEYGPWGAKPPSYNEVIEMGLLPIAIFDVAIQHKGYIVHAFEVVHRNDISDTKLEYINRIVDYSAGMLQVRRIDADWILSRVKRPVELICDRVA